MGEQKTALILLLILYFAISSLPLVSAAGDLWTIMEPMPTFRVKFELVVSNGRIYAIGGSHQSQQIQFGINEEYNPETNTWNTKESMPTPRTSFGTFVFQDKIYCIAGYSREASHRVGVNEVYDPVSDTWEMKASMPTNRSDMQTKMVDGKIYFIGGVLGYDYEKSEITYSQANEVYDPVTDSWDTRTSVPVNGEFGAHVFGDKIYCVFNDSLEVYDTKGDSWTQKASVPVPAVYAYYTVVVENRIYFLLPSEGSYTQIYDVQNDTWSSGENIPIDINQPAVVATSGNFAPKRIYLVGGFTEFVDSENTTYVYDPAADHWSLGASMTISRYNIHLVVVDDVLYAIGGAIHFGGSTSAVEKYTPEGYIPEFPSWIILPLFLTATLVIVYLRKKLKEKS